MRHLVDPLWLSPWVRHASAPLSPAHASKTSLEIRPIYSLRLDYQDNGFATDSQRFQLIKNHRAPFTIADTKPANHLLVTHLSSGSQLQTRNKSHLRQERHPFRFWSHGMQSKVLRICVLSRYARDKTSVKTHFSANQIRRWTGHGHSLTLADDPLSQIFSTPQPNEGH